MTTSLIEQEIQLLETFSKQGDSYTNNEGRYGWRNPIRSDTGDLLRCLTLSAAPRRTLEIGTGHGLSALYMVSGLSDHAQQHIDTIEFDADVARSSQARFDTCRAPVTVKQGEAVDVIGQLSGSYDMVFFDAQKNHYLRQLLALLERKLIGPGTVILADNVIDRRSECEDFLAWFGATPVDHYILRTECGLLVAHL